LKADGKLDVRTVTGLCATVPVTGCARKEIKLADPQQSCEYYTPDRRAVEFSCDTRTGQMVVMSWLDVDGCDNLDYSKVSSTDFISAENKCLQFNDDLLDVFVNKLRFVDPLEVEKDKTTVQLVNRGFVRGIPVLFVAFVVCSLCRASQSV
jgi:hypothetical protein